MPNPDFLKKLQESLQKGEKSEVSEYINEIDKLANTLSAQQAAENLDKRIKENKPVEEMGEEDRKNAEALLNQLDKEQKENDEKLAFLAEIQQKISNIDKINTEYEAAKFGYEKKIEKLEDEKITLINDFEKKYGTSAINEYNTQLGINKKIE